MRKLISRVKIVFLTLIILLSLSCSTEISVKTLPEEGRIKQIIRDQGKSVVFIGVYDNKENLILFGSGFFISSDGFIITNYHVIEKGYSAVIKRIDGKFYDEVYLISCDEEKDIALLKVDETNSPFAILGDSQTASQGDKVITIGNPQGFQNTVSDGIISAVRDVERIKLFQITCPISQGSSGGPLYNLRGEVIGIATLMSDVGQNLNFAIPINYIRLLQKDQYKLSLKEKYLKDQKKLLENYLEKQKMSSQLDPKDTIYPEAYELYKKAKAASGYSAYFSTYGTSNQEAIDLLELAIEIDAYYQAAYYVLGRSYGETKKYALGEQSFLKCIELKPKYQNAYIALADLYKHMDRYEEALRYYNKALNIGSPTGWIYSGIGDVFLERADFDKAEQFYKKMFDFEDFLSIGYEKLALLYLRKGDLELSWNNLKKSHLFPLEKQELKERIDLYKQYIEKDNFYAYESIGCIYHYSFKYKEAIINLEKARKLNPRKFSSYFELAMSYKNEDDYRKAILFLEEAVSRQPNHYQSNLRLGLLYDIEPITVSFYEQEYKIKPNYQRAIELFEKCKEINPKEAQIYYYIGRVYYHMKQYENAIAETEIALNIHENYDTYRLLGDIYFDSGNYTMAVKNYKKAMKIDDSAYIRSTIAEALVKLEEYNEAINLLNESIKKYPESSWLSWELADVYLEKKDYSTAIDYYQNALKEYTESYMIHFQIAYCYDSFGASNNAEKWYLKAINIDPKREAPYFNLGLLYVKNKDYSNALKYFEKALQLGSDKDKTNIWINTCKEVLEEKAFPDKLRELSEKIGDIGLLARIFLCVTDYSEGNDLFIQGVKDTEPKYEKIGSKKIITQYIVSSKIYEAQGYFEKVKADLNSISGAKGKIAKIVNLFLFAAEQRIKGIEQYSRGYYVKAKDYSGEWEKGSAKINIADKYLLDGLKILREEIAKYPSHFGPIAERKLDFSIEYYQKK